MHRRTGRPDINCRRRSVLQVGSTKIEVEDVGADLHDEGEYWTEEEVATFLGIDPTRVSAWARKNRVARHAVMLADDVIHAMADATARLNAQYVSPRPTPARAMPPARTRQQSPAPQMKRPSAAASLSNTIAPIERPVAPSVRNLEMVRSVSAFPPQLEWRLPAETAEAHGECMRLKYHKWDNKNKFKDSDGSAVQCEVCGAIRVLARDKTYSYRFWVRGRR